MASNIKTKLLLRHLNTGIDLPRVGLDNIRTYPCERSGEGAGATTRLTSTGP